MFKEADLKESLNSVPWFRELEPAGFERLATIASLVRLEAGEFLFHEGDRVNDFYVILEGQISLQSYVPGKGTVCTLQAEPLDAVGWTSMTSFIRQHTSTACASTRCLLIALDSSSLRKLCDEDHNLGYVIMRRLTNIIATRVCLYDLIIQSENAHSTE
jgi:CRP-like cAMP-binding protein